MPIETAALPAALPPIFWAPAIAIHRRYDRGGYVMLYEDEALGIIRTHSRAFQLAALIITWRLSDDLTNTEYRDYREFAKAYYARYPYRLAEMQEIADRRAEGRKRP